MTNEIRTVLFGIGPIGGRIAKVILEKRGLRIVGAVDVAEDKVGRDLGELLGLKKRLGVEIEADVAVVATTSYVRTVYPLLVSCIAAGLDVVSTCEELAYPWLSEPQLASQIDGLAKDYGVTVLGTGVNPGYLLDMFPLVLSGLCKEVKKIEAVRAISTKMRRESFQKKIGTGMSPKEFLEKIEKGEITGHVGFRESVALTAAAMGLKLDEIVELPPEPVIADKEVKTTYTTVKPGQMLGYVSMAKGIRNGKDVIIYKLIMHAGVDEGYGEYRIEGTPNIKVRLSEVLGDWETAHVVVNMIPKVINARPGLLTMKDLPPPCALLDDARILTY